MIKCSLCGSVSICVVGNGYYCSCCASWLNNNLEETEQYSHITALPTKGGFYWVTHADLGFWTVVYVINDKLTLKDIWRVRLLNGKMYELSEFCDLGEQVFWSGPIKNPDENIER